MERLVTTLRDILEGYTPAEREAIHRRASELRVQDETLQEFRLALAHAHDVIAGRLPDGEHHGPVPQEANEKILGLLHQCLEAMGGRYSIIIELPDRPPLALIDFEVSDDEFHERGSVYHEMAALRDDWLERAAQ